MNPAVKIRASSMPTWEDCERRGAVGAIPFEIVERGYQIPGQWRNGIAAAIGTAVHLGAALLLEHRMQDIDMDLEAATYRSLIKLDELFRERLVFDDITPTRDIARWQVRKILRVYHDDLAPWLNPVAVEQHLSCVIRIDGIDIQVSGHVDTLEATKVRDFKSGRSGRAYGSQLGTYSLLARSHGYDIRDIVEDAIPRPKFKGTTEVETARYDLIACERQAHWVLRRAARAILDFRESGVPEAFMANPQSTLCSQRWCRAYQTPFCRVHRITDG